MSLMIDTCCENLHTCIWFEGGERRNVFASIVAGILFFTGWWLIIDASVVHPESVRAIYHVCGVVGTLSLFMINSVSNSLMRGNSYAGGSIGPSGARAWLFIGFFLGFAAVIASCGILVASGGKPGIGLFLQNLFIFAGSLVYKFGRVEDDWGIH